MWPFILCAALLLTPGLAAPGQTRPGAGEPSLVLKAEVTDERYCAGASGVEALHIRLRLRFENAGARKLILYRGANIFFQVAVRSDLERQPPTQYEVKTTSARYLQREPEALEGRSPGRDFVVLAPGQRHQFEVGVSLPVVRGGRTPGRGEVAAGEHLMVVKVSTWYESKALGEKLRERWKKAGLLWTTPVTSEPVPFAAGPGPPSGRCP